MHEMDHESSLYCIEEIVGSPWNHEAKLGPAESSEKVLHPSYVNHNFNEEGFAQDDAALISLFEKERIHMAEGGYVVAMSSENLFDSRLIAVLWILKVCKVFNFSPITAALAVNYFDRYLSKHTQTLRKRWMIQLLSVACLSLAAKMEEVDVPLLLDLQAEGSEYVFEARTIQRMELVVLGALGWRMNAVTAMSFVDDLLNKVDRATHNIRRSLKIRITELLVGTLTGHDFIEFRPSIVAVSALCCALQEISPMDAERQKHALSTLFPEEKDKLDRCYNLVEEHVADPLYPILLTRIAKPEVPRSPVNISEVSADQEFPIRLRNALTWFRSSCSLQIVPGHLAFADNLSVTSRKRKRDEQLK